MFNRIASICMESCNLKADKIDLNASNQRKVVHNGRVSRYNVLRVCLFVFIRVVFLGYLFQMNTLNWGTMYSFQNRLPLEPHVG